jgi:hypothetical protein
MADDTRAAVDQHPPRVWTWLVLVVAVVATIGLTGFVDWFVMFGQSSTCGDPPDPGEARTGRIALAAVLVVALAPWVLATAKSPHRVAVGVAGLVAVLPAFGLLLNGLRTEAWVGGFCF